MRLIKRQIGFPIAHHAPRDCACAHKGRALPAGDAGFARVEALAIQRVARKIGVGERHAPKARQITYALFDRARCEIWRELPQVGEAGADHTEGWEGFFELPDAAQHARHALQRVLVRHIGAAVVGAVHMWVDIGIANCKIEHRKPQLLMQKRYQRFRLRQVRHEAARWRNAEAIGVGKAVVEIHAAGD